MEDFIGLVFVLKYWGWGIVVGLLGIDCCFLEFYDLKVDVDIYVVVVDELNWDDVVEVFWDC